MPISRAAISTTCSPSSPMAATRCAGMRGGAGAGEKGARAAPGPPPPPAVPRRYRMNIGTIVQEPLMRLKFRRGRMLGEVEEHFIQQLVPGDSFVFGGQLL